jgi:hypothetical protein
MSLRLFLSTFLSLVIIQLAPNFAAAGETPPYVLVDSGFPANEQYRPFWLDNARVIFKGYEPGSYNEAMRKTLYAQAKALGYEGGMKTGYYIWDTETANVNLYKDKIEDLCVEDGKSIYRTIPSKEGEKAVVWRGTFGQEEPTDIEPWPFVSLQRNCWDVVPIRTDAQEGRHPIRLRPDWGYLDLGPVNPPFDLTAPVLYYRTGQTEPIKLPIPRSKLRNGGRVVFVPHDGRHFLIEGQGNGSIVPQAWFLAAHGVLTNVTLPAGPWSGGRLYPVRNGIFLSSWFTKGKSLREPGGAYLIRDGRWQLLFTGFKSQAGISADGCKVALTVAPNQQAHYARNQEWQAGRPSQQTMRMISVCEGGTK